MEDTFKKMDIPNIVINIVKKASLVGIIYLFGYWQLSFAWFIAPVALFVARDKIIESNKERREIAKAIALSDEKVVITSNLKNLPAWVFFPDIERAEWINKTVNQLWPNINQFVKELVRDKIQPVIRKKLDKKNIKGFKFETIRLGSVPFRLGGVKVYDDKVDRNEIVMDLDLWYSGNSYLTFLMSGFKGGIKDLQLHGMVRVILKPLMSSMPLVGGVQVFFLDQPKIDFELTGVADLLEIPGISGVLKHIIFDTIAAIMVLPNKFTIKLSEEIDTMELRTPEPEGVLRVHIFEAKNLMRKDVTLLMKGKSDPFAVASIGAQEYKTKVIDNTVDPKWDYWCEFQVMEPNGQVLHIQLWDKDDTGDDEKLGSVNLDLSNMSKEGHVDQWYTLENAKHGMIHLRMTWLSISSDYGDLERTLTETQLLRSSNLNSAILILFIDSAKNLPRNKLNTDPDPYAIIDVGNKIHQTPFINKTINPVWEEGFTFLLPNPSNDMLSLKIRDKKTDLELGSLVLRIKKLCENNCFDIRKEQFTLQHSAPDCYIILSLKLKILKLPPNNYTEIGISNDKKMTDSHQEILTKPESPKMEKRDVAPVETKPISVEEVIKEATVSLASSSPASSLADTLSIKSTHNEPL